MITKEIAAKVWHCYNEIEQAGKMIEELKGRLNSNGELEIKDRWGDGRKGLELHIPNQGGSYSIKHLPFQLALDTINLHVEEQKKELLRLKEVCKIQLH